MMYLQSFHQHLFGISQEKGTTTFIVTSAMVKASESSWDWGYLRADFFIVIIIIYFLYPFLPKGDGKLGPGNCSSDSSFGWCYLQMQSLVCNNFLTYQVISYWHAALCLDMDCAHNVWSLWILCTFSLHDVFPLFHNTNHWYYDLVLQVGYKSCSKLSVWSLQIEALHLAPSECQYSVRIWKSS